MLRYNNSKFKIQNSKLQLKIKSFFKKTSNTFNFELLTLNLRNRYQNGQTLLEVIVVIAVGIIVVGALVFATISSLRNAATAKNQAQATKLAQEGLEKVRTSRDRNGQIANFTGTCVGCTSWVSTDPLWTRNLSTAGICGTPPSGCYFTLNFTLNPSGDLDYITFSASPPSTGGEQIGNFRRFIILSDDANFAKWKIAEALVTWSDFAGSHQSRMKSILRCIGCP